MAKSVHAITSVVAIAALVAVVAIFLIPSPASVIAPSVSVACVDGLATTLSFDIAPTEGVPSGGDDIPSHTPVSGCPAGISTLADITNLIDYTASGKEFSATCWGNPGSGITEWIAVGVYPADSQYCPGSDAPCVVVSTDRIPTDCLTAHGTISGAFSGHFVLTGPAAPQPACGNGVCEAGEDASNCPEDCHEAPPGPGPAGHSTLILVMLIAVMAVIAAVAAAIIRKKKR